MRLFSRKQDIFLYNTKSREKELFKPLGKRVKMYSCGPTVYNYAHLGNLRSYVFADTLKRTLLYGGYKVDHVINITDVGHLVSDGDTGEDKVEREARQKKKSAKEITDFYTKAFFLDLEKLNIKTDDVTFPRATEYIKEQINLIRKLEEKGYTYKTSDGIYFDTSKFPKYGVLGGSTGESRIEENTEKKNPEDFALWKFSKENRLQEWDSPWGIGFPGWHIECSAMSMSLLGESIDIHTGGVDHITVHHNNETAQSECSTGKPFVNIWMHNEFLNTEGGKMAKSKENFLRLSYISPPLAFRYFLLQAHYRSQLDFSESVIEASETALSRLRNIISEYKDNGKVNKGYKGEFTKAISDDLNTPKALSLIWDLIKDETVEDEDKKATILDFDKVLGLRLDKVEKVEVPEEVLKLVKEREKAREESNWQEADRIRDEVAKVKFKIKDTDDGSVIEKL
ncbi:MAG: cysteine--tRNA ligase [Candidatus Pacebacteria bacterium]|nr:cysteine--tRNA ligase [Candidatus Paceibacterota bacterium]